MIYLAVKFGDTVDASVYFYLFLRGIRKDIAAPFDFAGRELEITADLLHFQT